MATNQTFTAYGIALVKKVDDATERAMERIAEEGQEMVHGFIETRGTANPKYGGKTAWSRTYRGKKGPSKGRINSGQMRADVEQETSRANKWTAIASFGWIKNYEDYYGQQEVGFDHPSERVGWIPGMFAMADAADLIIPVANKIFGEEFARV